MLFLFIQNDSYFLNGVSYALEHRKHTTIVLLIILPVKCWRNRAPFRLIVTVSLSICRFKLRILAVLRAILWCAHGVVYKIADKIIGVNRNIIYVTIKLTVMSTSRKPVFFTFAAYYIYLRLLHSRMKQRSAFSVQLWVMSFQRPVFSFEKGWIR